MTSNHFISFVNNPLVIFNQKFVEQKQKKYSYQVAKTSFNTVTTVLTVTDKQ